MQGDLRHWGLVSMAPMTRKPTQATSSSFSSLSFPQPIIINLSARKSIFIEQNYVCICFPKVLHIKHCSNCQPVYSTGSLRNWEEDIHDRERHSRDGEETGLDVPKMFWRCQNMSDTISGMKKNDCFLLSDEEIRCNIANFSKWGCLSE